MRRESDFMPSKVAREAGFNIVRGDESISYLRMRV
jgi:hypothetical protein